MLHVIDVPDLKPNLTPEFNNSICMANVFIVLLGTHFLKLKSFK